MKCDHVLTAQVAYLDLVLPSSHHSSSTYLIVFLSVQIDLLRPGEQGLLDISDIMLPRIKGPESILPSDMSASAHSRKKSIGFIETMISNQASDGKLGAE